MAINSPPSADFLQGRSPSPYCSSSGKMMGNAMAQYPEDCEKLSCFWICFRLQVYVSCLYNLFQTQHYPVTVHTDQSEISLSAKRNVTFCLSWNLYASCVIFPRNSYFNKYSLVICYRAHSFLILLYNLRPSQFIALVFRIPQTTGL